MKVSVFGAGYVGLVTAAGMAEIGHSVLCADIDKEKITKLSKGIVPFFEPGLTELVLRNIQANRISFTTDINETSSFGDVLFIAVGTPALPDGSADLSSVMNLAKTIGKNIDRPKIVVDKSTVPVGTAHLVKTTIEDEMSQRDVDFDVHVVSNPEFLKEGAAVEDFMKPDRIVIGADSTTGFEILEELFEPFQRKQNVIIRMDIISAELTKYAANAMLATRISFMNEIAAIAEQVGADIEHVRQGIGSDPRIGSSFLYAGCGFGGSCFPKDINALIHAAEEVGVQATLLKSINQVNKKQQQLLFRKINDHFDGELSNKVIAIWGLSFKPDTDDMRDSPSIPLIEKLVNNGARIRAYDPVALPRAKEVLSELPNVDFYEDKYVALQGADTLALVTEWKEFRAPDFSLIAKSLNQSVVFDGRNQWDPSKLEALGFTYFGIGRGRRTTYKN